MTDHPGPSGPSWPPTPRSGVSPCFGPRGLPGGQQPVLQAEHFRVLLGLGVVVAEQVKDSVRAEQVDLVLHLMAGLGGLHLGHLRTDHHVSKQGLPSLGIPSRHDRHARRYPAAEA